MKDNLQKLEKLLSDEAFSAKLFAAKDSIETLKLLESKGVYLSAEELAMLRSTAKAPDSTMVSDEKLADMNDELTDDELELVAGGAPGMPTLEDFGEALNTLLGSKKRAELQRLNSKLM
ncbi:MAG: hypothetical protein IKN55_12070 [Oscillospiraceae bacterium]|nr:hypothetical protein [Oscillospiraceae bacterium]